MYLEKLLPKGDFTPLDNRKGAGEGKLKKKKKKEDKEKQAS